MDNSINKVTYSDHLHLVKTFPPRDFSDAERMSGYKAAYNAVSDAADRLLKQKDDAIVRLTVAEKFCQNWVAMPDGDDPEEDLKWFVDRRWFWDTPTLKKKESSTLPAATLDFIDNIDGDTSGVTLASVAAFKLRGQEKLTNLLNGMSDDLASLTVSEVTGLVTLLIHTLKTLPSNSVFGEVKPITEEQYHAWEVTNSAETQPFGPYLFMKALLQGGANWEYYEDERGTPYLIIERNGVRAYSTHKHMIELDHLDQGEDIQRQEFTMICKDLFDSGRQIRLEQIPTKTYDVANMILFRHDIRYHEKTLLITARQTPVSYGREHNRNLDDIAQELLKDETKPGKNADDIIDWMVRLINRKHRKHVSTLSHAYEEAKAIAHENVDDFASLCSSKADEKDDVKFAFLAKSGVVNSVQGAINALNAARKLRNREECPQISQYIQKGAASVYSPGMMPMFDTHIKLKKVIEQLNALIPKDWDEYGVQVYGVAYNHMGNAIDSLDRHGKVTYYDIEKAKNSNKVFETGDIFDLKITDKRTVVIDDTLTKNVPVQHKHRHPQVHNGSLFKLKCILQARPDIVATKMSLDAFLDEGSMAMLLGATGYRFVSVAKYGKLHNEEVFVILSKHSTRIRNKPSMIRGDFQVIANAIQVANKTIMMADVRGVSLSMNPREWRRVLGVLPINWSWYVDPNTKDDSFRGSGGKALFNDQNIDIEFDNGKNFVVEDVGFIEPKNCLFDLSGCPDMVCFEKLMVEKPFTNAYIDGNYVIEGKKDLPKSMSISGRQITLVGEIDFNVLKRGKPTNDFVANYVIEQAFISASKGLVGVKRNNWRKNQLNK